MHTSATLYPCSRCGRCHGNRCAHTPRPAATAAVPAPERDEGARWRTDWLDEDAEWSSHSRRLFAQSHGRAIDAQVDTAPLGTYARLEAAEGLRQYVSGAVLETLGREGRVLDREQIRPVGVSHTPSATVRSMWRAGLWPMKVIAASAGVSEREAYRLLGVTDMWLKVNRFQAAEKYELDVGRSMAKADAQQQLSEQEGLVVCDVCDELVETRDSCVADVVTRRGAFLTTQGRVERSCPHCERQLWSLTTAMHTQIPRSANAHLAAHGSEVTVTVTYGSRRLPKAWQHYAVLTLQVRCGCGCGLVVNASKKQAGAGSFDPTCEVLDPGHVCVAVPRRRRTAQERDEQVAV